MTPDDLARAACNGTAPLMDEPDRNEATAHWDTRRAQARALCRTCPVTDACRADILDQAPRDRTGIHAGQLWRQNHPNPTDL